jgi:hypothetical protein
LKLSPSILYGVLSDHQLHMQELVDRLSQEAPRQRNCNEQGVFLRKLLLLLDNFFSNSEIHHHFPQLEAVATLFPAFSLDARQKYAEDAAIINHPAGMRARPPVEFGFMRRNKERLDSLAGDDLENLP